MIDFSKAFDSVNHILLINKLKLLNLTDDIIQVVFFLFLIDREQFTKIGEQRSATRITRSIVHGSGFGSSPLITFADITEVIQHILKWAEVSEMTINTFKTNF